jgi:coenzyme Q-binding protein COQ10
MILRNLFPSVTRKYTERKVLPTHPLHLFRIIQDVDKYERFLPLCHYSKIIRISKDGRSFDGKLKIGSKYFSEEYVSRVTVIPETYTIETTSIESTKFESLKSRWTLGEVIKCDEERTEIHCHVDFEVEMTVSDPVIVAVLDQVLQQVASRQVQAFEQRCRDIPIDYGLIEAAKRFRQ